MLNNFIFNYLRIYNFLNKTNFYYNAFNSFATPYDYIVETTNHIIDNSNNLNPFTKEFYKALINVSKNKSNK